MEAFRNNLLCWYPFRKDSLILEIFHDEYCFDDATHIKTDKLNEVVDKYDYIILNAVIRFVDPVELLNKCLDILNDDGHILIITENKLGSKYLSGFKDEYNHHAYSSLHGNHQNPAYTKKELEKIISMINLKNHRFYYPHPDYRNVREIFTDSSINKINKSSITNSLIHDDLLAFDNEIFDKLLVEQGCADIFANSFLIDLSNDVVENDIDYIKISFNRSKEFQLYTQLDYKNAKVYKKALNDYNHLENIARNSENKTVFDTLKYTFNGQYLQCDLLDVMSLDDLFKNDISYLDLFKKKIIDGEYKQGQYDDRFTEVFGDIKADEKLHWKKNVNIDLKLDNIFVKDDKWIIIDPEWVFDFEIPMEFVLYRSLKDSEFKEYLDYDKKLMEVFDSWDNHFVYEYVSSQIVDYKGRQLMDIHKLQDQLNETIMKCDELQQRISKIENSIIWKKSEFLRRIADKIKNK